MDETVKKCVIIAHSQGGIILANVLDSLFADLPYSALEKVEIYTFGYAPSQTPIPPNSSSQKQKLTSVPATQPITSITL